MWAICHVEDSRAQNYDESKVPDYVLPDLLTCIDGTKVTTIEQWEQKRRPELLDMFFDQVYGYTPDGNVDVSYEVLAEKDDALDGLATAQQVMFTFSGEGKEVKALALVYIPKYRQGTVPVFIGYNFQGNHNTTTDEWVLYSPYFDRLTDRDNPLLGRGAQVERWPVKSIISRGYALVTMCYHDIYPDNVSGASQSVTTLLPQTANANSRWQAIGAWAWGSSRIADWVVKQPWANPEQLTVIGHSRQGKAAIWAGVQDTRFKVVISNDSGCGGAALSKRAFGETIDAITSSFPHWFCRNFSSYANREQDLPFDQHELLALVAPRHLYVASASEDSWSDPRGEYLSAYYASPVFELYGMTGLTSPDMPEVEQPISNDIGHHIRKGTHNMLLYDWTRYMDFCDKFYGVKPYHEYVDGICQLCGQPDSEYKTPNAEGFYELGSAADFNWFACMVNSGLYDLNAMLTADIDEYRGPVIADADHYYAGTFDGQYHKITYYSQAAEARWGLFRTLSGVVKNLHVAGTLTTAINQCGGIVGFIHGGTIENCVSTVDIVSSFSGDSGTGGVVATSMLPSLLKNCIFAGTIQGKKARSCGGIMAWIASAGAGTRVENCIVISEIEANSKDGNIITRNPGNALITNCYYVHAFGSTPSEQVLSCMPIRAEASSATVPQLVRQPTQTTIPARQYPHTRLWMVFVRCAERPNPTSLFRMKTVSTKYRTQDNWHGLQLA